jgi:hypothetical protein
MRPQDPDPYPYPIPHSLFHNGLALQARDSPATGWGADTPVYLGLVRQSFEHPPPAFTDWPIACPERPASNGQRTINGAAQAPRSAALSGGPADLLLASTVFGRNRPGDSLFFSHQLL